MGELCVGGCSSSIDPKLFFARARCRWSRSLAVPATGLRARWPRTGVRGLHDGHCAATTARRELIVHLLLALQMWRNNVFQSTCCNFACGGCWHCAGRHVRTASSRCFFWCATCPRRLRAGGMRCCCCRCCSAAAAAAAMAAGRVATSGSRSPAERESRSARAYCPAHPALHARSAQHASTRA